MASVVKSKQFALKPMSVQEATLQLELVGHDFFVFTNAESSRTNVVYRRNDGHYGLIEPRAEATAGASAPCAVVRPAGARAVAAVALRRH